MKKVFLFVIMVMFALFMRVDRLEVKAASKYVTNYAVNNEVTAGGATFVARQYMVGNEYRYRLIMTKNGVSKIIAENTRCGFTTDGKIIYYVVRGAKKGAYSYKNTIYQYNLKKGKKKKIVSGTDYTVIGCSGKYIYCGRDYGPDGVDLYAVNVATKKKKHMVDVVGNVVVMSDRVITNTNTGSMGNYPVYSFKMDGSGKKKICDGALLNAKGKKLYYFVVDEKTYSKFKIYCCNSKGKKKKAVTGWIDRIPEKYYK